MVIFQSTSAFPLLHRLGFRRCFSGKNMYIQHSKIPTMHFQPSLPRLPIPKLELTCERYLAAQRPLLIDEYYHKTEDTVWKFRDTHGKELQKLLKENDKQNKHTSYISEAWFDMYLSLRKPLPLNFNPMLVFQNDPKKEYNNQLIRTANLLLSSLKFYKSLKAGILEPEVFHLNPKKSDNETFRNICSKIPSPFSWYAAFLFKAYPLDMSQYPSLFNTTRIPEIDKDRLYTNHKAKHITVQRNGYFYAFDVLDENDNIISPNSILARLKYIIDDNIKPNEFPIGVLTTLERNKWATLRHNLTELGNQDTFKIIDSSLFNICLDDESIGEDLNKLIRIFLHGNGDNRWFDKSFSLQVSKDGFAGVNFEHSWGDGVAVLRYFQDIYKDTTKNPLIHPDTKPSDEANSSVKRLQICLDENTKSEIKSAQNSYKSWCDSLSINAIELEGVGRKNCRQFNISPDALMQMSFQAAYYKIHDCFVPSYESCSTAAFKHGRTETVRPCTVATKSLSEALVKKNRPSNIQLKQLVQECSRVHMQLTREAAMGQGFDRHLYALELLAKKSNYTENIFDDPAYENLQKNIISTSTLSSPAVRAGGFGPVVENGLGLGYVIKDEYIGTLVTNYPKQNGKEFIDCLKETIDDIMKILHSK
ncbi:carnitine O-palmitoyltransferase 2, mitochondrial [Onthophagus taurus]|uniref:carnitine O-palmitoyltransferase 2, mitochondrial n=1 Tax=Onthophagus taurus TaxID=166361 RepID=UPI000C201660|nr:carnitine O-palmitoyltransferase 2, mitochondrial [Onthophagus taurus]